MSILEYFLCSHAHNLGNFRPFDWKCLKRKNSKNLARLDHWLLASPNKYQNTKFLPVVDKKCSPLVKKSEKIEQKCFFSEAN